MSNKNNHICPNCLKPCKIKPSYLKRTGTVCCSMACRTEYYKKYPEFNHSYKNRTQIEKFFDEKFTRWKSSARKRKIVFDNSLTSKDLYTLWLNQNERCYYTNIPMSINKEDVLRLVSIDRKDSSIGYTLDNIVLCCYSINSFKFSFSIEEVNNFIKLIYENYKVINNKIEVEELEQTDRAAEGFGSTGK